VPLAGRLTRQGPNLIPLPPKEPGDFCTAEELAIYLNLDHADLRGVIIHAGIRLRHRRGGFFGWFTREDAKAVIRAYRTRKKGTDFKRIGLGAPPPPKILGTLVHDLSKRARAAGSGKALLRAARGQKPTWQPRPRKRP